MLNVLSKFFLGSQLCFKLFLLLSIPGIQGFLTNKNTHSLSQLSFKNDQNIDFFYTNTKCSSLKLGEEFTHPSVEGNSLKKSQNLGLNKPESANVLALLCENRRTYEILGEIFRSMTEKRSKIKRILYLTPYETDITSVIKYLKNIELKKFNIISGKTISVFPDSFITLAETTKLFNLYQFLNNHNQLKTPESIKFNQIEVKINENSEILNFLSSFLGNFFMNTKEINEEVFKKNPKTEFDTEFFTASKDFIDSHYVQPDYVSNLVSGELAKENLVVLDKFSFEFSVEKNELIPYFDDYLLVLLKKNCTFLGISKTLYNPQQVRDWLNTLFGSVKVVTLSKCPKFELLTSQGHLEIFNEKPVKYARKFENLDGTNIKEIISYITKKSNLPRLTNVNPEMKEVVVNAIKDSLKSKGIDTLQKALRVSLKINKLLKASYRSLRFKPSFIYSKDKLGYLLRNMVDIPNQRILSSFVRYMDLLQTIKTQQMPTIDQMVNYIDEKGLFPTILYKFEEGIEKMVDEFYQFFIQNENVFADFKVSLSNVDLELLSKLDKKRLFLLERGVFVLNKNDHYKFKGFVQNNLHILRIVISNKKLSGAPHYIFIDLTKTKDEREFILSNVDLFSYALGAELVTFTLHYSPLFHIMRSLYCPCYLNLSNLSFIHQKHYGSHSHLEQKRFHSYLSQCRELHSIISPQYLEYKDLFEKLESYLNENKVETDNLLKIKTRSTQFTRFISIMNNSLKSKFFFRSKIISFICRKLDMKGCTVLGLDGVKYRILSYGKIPVDSLVFKDSETEDLFKKAIKRLQEEFVLLENPEEGNYIMADYKFIKDILSLDKIGEEKKVEVENFVSGSVIPQNDLIKYINVKLPGVKYIKINSKIPLRNPKLTDVIPKCYNKRIFAKIQKKEKDLRLLEEIFRNSEKAPKFEHEKMKNKKTDIRSLADEYVKLDGRLKKVRLEHILEDHRFRQSAWGK